MSTTTFHFKPVSSRNKIHVLKVIVHIQIRKVVSTAMADNKDDGSIDEPPIIITVYNKE